MHQDSCSELLGTEIDVSFQHMSMSLSSVFNSATGTRLDSLTSQLRKIAVAGAGAAPAPSASMASSSSTTPPADVGGLGPRPSHFLFSSFQPVPRAAAAVPAAEVTPKVKAKAKGGGRRRSRSESEESSGDSEMRARGRPASNREADLREAIAELERSGPDEKYFGQQTDFRRRLDRYIDELKKVTFTPAEIAEKHAQEEAAGKEKGIYYSTEDESIVILTKRGQEAANVAKSWARKQSYDDAFKQTMDAAVIYLSTPPTAPVPFPAWLKQRYISSQIEVAHRTDHPSPKVRGVSGKYLSRSEVFARSHIP